MAAFVGADSAETPGSLQIRKMFLYGRSVDTKKINHILLRSSWHISNKINKTLNRFLTTFSDHFLP